ncbi:OmpH family outer membrane protein [Flavobacterium arcticum]|uniref:OmpH family outer membrane protein n=1 Tax=Flavobacterium arcticum TaxID=1784713 RepID=A0A345HC51_9FLAO|nr:OmpH family outer membrane protein [Flavobacterium arcticum]AXG74161.1 OmpH family outer membrane protein [Flavobacterium arcticum]KAF2508252.1 OmpH family outer membrane protein [Flavobacterium arcticum]
MKKIFLVLFTIFATATATAQRGVKIAYIDMEYILDKVSDYAEAKNQLEQKAQKWKQEIEVKRNDINKLKEGLKTERALLTKELIEEREEEIAFQEKELLDYQLKRFGPTGDLISQKSVLVKPIQDQVFTIIQDLAEARNYDFVFDKSSDLTMLFAANRHDISDLIVRRLTRAAKQSQLTSKELKKLESEEAQEDLEADPEYQARQKKLEDRKAERQRIIDERKAAQEAKRKEYQERREKLLQEREAKKNERNGVKTTDTEDKGDVNSTDDPAPTEGDDAPQPKSNTTENNDKQTAAEAAREAREKKLEDRRKAAEERRAKILADREAAKKARDEERNKNNTPETTDTETTDEE